MWLQNRYKQLRSLWFFVHPKINARYYRTRVQIGFGRLYALRVWHNHLYPHVQQSSRVGLFFVHQQSAVVSRYGTVISLWLLAHLRHKSRVVHHHTMYRPHAALAAKWQWYDRWHAWDKHPHVHYSVASTYLVVIVAFFFVSYQRAWAASDIFDNWDFTVASDYTIDNGLETSGSSVRMKAQNYETDENTRALFHMDETSGTSVEDSSTNGNDAALTGTTTWQAGSLNNAVDLDGATAMASLSDNASVSLTQSNTLEAWTKFDESFAAGTHDHKQGVIEKGSYRLYYDQETGKATYELANTSAETWTQQAGNDIKGSWDLNGKLSINAQVHIGDDLYVGLGNAVGDAEVWKWDGTTWSMVGGDGINSSWATNTFENVSRLVNNGDTLYAGLGSSAGDAEVWSCDTATGCTTWTKIGGDAVNSSWAVNTFEQVMSMTVMGGNVYVGLGLSANDARVYRWNGTTWTWVGGFGIGAPYNAFTTGYEGVYTLTNDGTNVYAGMGNGAGDADVWRLTGTTWTQIGGDAVNSSWAASTFDAVQAIRYVGSTLYVGLGVTAGEAEVWSWNGSAWTKIGGDTVNSSWDSSSYEGVYSFTDDGTNLYAGLGASAGDNEVWRWNGTTWTKIGGDAVNSGFTNTHTVVQDLAYDDGVLYAGLQATGANAEVWTYNGTTWTRIGGGYLNNSWGFFNLQNVETMTISGDYLYAGTGNTVAGNAQVWRFDGTTWTQVGGQGINGSWAFGTYENVLSMISVAGQLYIGLGTTANDAEVWRYNGTTWTQIGGDSLNSSWGAGFEEVSALATLDGELYAGLANSANDAEVWRYNGSTWAKVGGDSINSGWTTNFERVSSLGVYNGQIYAGLGASATDAEVWRYNGSTWAKVGGDGVSSSWNTVYEQVETLLPYNGKLYAGLGNSTGDAEIWEYNGTAWTQIGGDGLNSSWIDADYEQAKTMVVYNGQLYAGLGNGAGNGEVWRYNGTTWTQIGGDTLNTSWADNTIETVQSFSVYKGKLYAGLGNTANADAAIWSFGNNGFVQSASTTQDTNWHHLAATYDGSTMRLYKDGNLEGQTAISLSMPDNTSPLLIGSTFGTSEAGWSQGYFTGQLDEVRISDVARSSFTTRPYTTTAQTVTLNDPVRTSGVWHWDNFTADETPSGGDIAYRLSDDDGATWQYWNGSAWADSDNLSESNTLAVIDAHMVDFPVTFDGIRWQAVLTSDGTERVTLNEVGLAASSDTTDPGTNASALYAEKANGGTALGPNAWTNGASPFFGWTAGNDDESGMKGYCVYLGTDQSADPETTKGLLGASPVDATDICPFVVSSATLDTAVSGYLGTALSTSNDAYYMTLKALDNAGNVTNSAEQFSFRFDNTSPSNPGYVTAPSGFINTKDVTLTWPTVGGSAPADGHSGLAGLQYRIGPSGTWYGDDHTGTGDSADLLANDGSYSTVPSPDHDDLQEGINTVYFRSWDQAGNVSSVYVTAALKINTAGAPSEPQNVDVSPSSNTTNSFSFDWDAPQTFVGEANSLTYCYTINTPPSLETCTFTGGGVTSLGAGPYATRPGSNTFYVVARDESSNVNYDNYAAINFTANTPSPGIPLNADIVDVSIKATSNWRLALTWEVPEYDGAGIASYKVYRSTDNSTFSFVGSSSSTTYIDANLSQQRYYYRVQACDSTNNCGANSSVVNELPTGKFTAPAALVAEPKVSNITTKKARINWSTDRASDSKIAIGTASGKYSPSEVAISEQVSAHQVDLDNLSAGTTYYFVARWTDEDGNTGVSQEYSFTTAPAPSLKEVSASRVALTGATIQFTSRDASRIDVYYGKSEGFGGLKSVNTSTAESSYAVELTGLDDGAKYFYKLVSYDSEGNSYDGSVASFTTPQRPRINDLRFQPVDGEPTSTQKVSWSTNVPATSTVNYGKAGTGGTEVSDSQLVTNHELVLRNLEDDSDYFLVAQSRDGDGNVAVSETQRFRTALDTRPPKISEIVVESSIRGTGAEARGQVVVSWKTDEPSSSQVAYAEGSNATIFNNKTSEDSELATEHIVIVSDLPTSKVYSIQPVSRDKAGNEGTGEPQSAIIGRASDSVLTIILNTLQKVFGF